MAEVEILLATYNGSQYLGEQLDSIAGQTFRDWHLLVRDDGSGDRTPELLDVFALRYPDQVRILKDGQGNLGACAGFCCLAASSSAPYIMFCDQDDVWFPEKIEKMLIGMKNLELQTGKEMPLLIHSDLEVTDKNLKIRDRSFWHYQRLNPFNAGKLNRLLVMNSVTGCAAMVNRPLLQKAVPFPSQAIVHDWWLTIVAASFGKVGIVPEALTYYRQHGENHIGAKGYSEPGFLKRIWATLISPAEQKSKKNDRRMQLQQAAAFYNIFFSDLSSDQKKLIKEYLKLYSIPPVFRFLHMVRYGFWRTGLLRNFAMGII